MRLISTGISVILHPIFFVTYMYFLYRMINPYLFISNDSKASGLITISVVSLTVLFPLLCILLMKRLGLIPTINMHNNKDRVGPLIATGLFYLWLYVNTKDNEIVPDIFNYYLLGVIIALFMAFFINNFTKISLHAIAVSSMVAAMFFLKFVFQYNEFLIKISSNVGYIVSVDLLIILSVILAGLTGTSRIFLKAHKNDQVYGGYLVGAFAHFIAYLVVF
jgi:hypothetical protein